MVFKTRARLDSAIVSVKAVGRSFPDAEQTGHHKVWLTVMMTEEGRRPVRMTRRAHECLTDLCGDQRVDLQGCGLNKDVRGKFVEHNGRRVVFALLDSGAGRITDGPSSRAISLTWPLPTLRMNRECEAWQSWPA